MANYFNPKPGRFGVNVTAHNSGRINTGTLAAGTQTHNIGGYPFRSQVSRCTVCAEVFPTATTVTIQLFKMTGATALALTAATDINAKTADVPIQIPVLSTLSEGQRSITTGDSLRVAIVTTGTVTVQPDDVTFTVELQVQE